MRLAANGRSSSARLKAARWRVCSPHPTPTERERSSCGACRRAGGAPPMLFADVVGSTELLASMGDAAWRDLLSHFHAAASEALRANRGVLVDLAGDGLLATFDGPARAVRSARALQRSAANLGIRRRAGIHTGEVERVGS